MTRCSRSSETIEQLHWPTLSSRRSYHKAKLVFLFVKVDFHCRVIFTCGLRAVTCVKFTFANKIEANVWEQWNIKGAFSRIMGFAPKLFLFSPLPPRPPFLFCFFFCFFFFCSLSNLRNNPVWNACYAGYLVKSLIVADLIISSTVVLWSLG